MPDNGTTNGGSTNESEDSPLDDVFIDGEDIDEEIAASILRPYVSIGSDSGQLHPNEEYESLTANEKILVTLVAQQAKKLRGHVDSAVFDPKEISEISGVKVGTVKPSVRELTEEGLIRDEGNGYSVDPPRLQRIDTRLSTDEEAGNS